MEETSKEQVLESLKDMIGQPIDYDVVICAFGNFEDPELQHGVEIERDESSDFVKAFVDKPDSTEFWIYTEKDETGEDIVTDVSCDGISLSAF